MISMDFFSRISRTIAAPMGPTPYCTARIFFLMVGSVALAGVPGGGFFVR
jgi:Na+/H+-dicarboxylate symporter